MPSSIPNFPVPVVRLVLVNERNRVLLLRRADGMQGEGGWCLPGGKIDYGQTVAEAIGRELEEETNLQITSLRFLLYQDSLPLEAGGMHCLNLYFQCEWSGSLVLNSESKEHAWIGKDEMDKYDIVFGNSEALQRYWAMKH